MQTAAKTSHNLNMIIAQYLTNAFFFNFHGKNKIHSNLGWPRSAAVQFSLCHYCVKTLKCSTLPLKKQTKCSWIECCTVAWKHQIDESLVGREPDGETLHLLSATTNTTYHTAGTPVIDVARQRWVQPSYSHRMLKYNVSSVLWPPLCPCLKPSHSFDIWSFRTWQHIPSFTLF